MEFQDSPDTAATVRLDTTGHTAGPPPRLGHQFEPEIPYRIEELDIPQRLVFDLFLRRVYADGTSTLRTLAEALKLTPPVVEGVFRHFRTERLLEVKGSSEDDYVFSLTSAGQRLAAHRNRVSQYIGPAPVSLRDYAAGIRAQRQRVHVTRESVQDALNDLVIEDGFVSLMGPAIRSQSAVFLYGPTGNGKTAVAERLHRIYTDQILIPYAVEVDGQIIIVHDPIVHQRSESQPDNVDPRWVLCRRPFVVIGGEMTQDMLELRLDDATRTYAAPVQMKANNGMLVIDDFGRQAIPPRKLLNRWIVPLDRRTDYLTLRYGVKFAVPFELKLIFATNIAPEDLADAAFLRRLPNKLYVGGVSDDAFDQIFLRYIRREGIDCDPGLGATLRRLCREHGCKELRACLAADVTSIANSVREFEEREGALTEEDFRRAAQLYFSRTMAFTDDDYAREAGASS